MKRIRFISALCIVAMLLTATPFASATEPEQGVQYQIRDSKDSTATKIVSVEALQDIASEDVSFEEYGQSKLYTYMTENFVYTVQFGTNGAVCFSFVSLEDGSLYQSDTFNISDLGWDNDLNYDVDDQIKMGIKIINTCNDIEMTELHVESTVNTSMQPLAASSTLSAHLVELFGADFNNKFLASETKEWDKSYVMRVHGNQTTYKINATVFDFAAGATVASVKAWVSAGKFNFSVKWFLDAAEAATRTVDGIDMIIAALHGEAYQYRCERVQRVTCPTYPNEIFYNASWVIECGFFRKTNSEWNDYMSTELHQPIYDNYSQLISNGFTQLVNRHLM